jgi:lipoprotein-releasing system permease protein
MTVGDTVAEAISTSGKRAAPRPAQATRPFSAFEWMLAWRYLRARRKERAMSVISTISLVSIAIGVAVLIIVMSVMNGFRHELLARILGIKGHVTVYVGGLSDVDKIVTRLRGISGVTLAIPLVDGQVLVSANGYNSGVLVRGMRKDDLKSLKIVSDTLSHGALENFDSSDSVIIGARLAQNLGLTPGQSITLIAPRGNVTPFGTMPRVKTYRIAGTFRIGMSEYDQTIVFMPLEEAQLFFGTGNAVTAIEIMVKDPDHVGSTVIPISRAVGPFARISTWQDIDSALFGALQVERNVMFLILALIILVADLNIISSLVMLVKDKSGDIAILRTMGATQGATMRVFLIAGTSLGVAGTAVGFLLGVVFCWNIESIRQFLSWLLGLTLFDPTVYFLSRMPAEMDAGEVAAVVVMALSLTFLATLYPSWRAARLDPVEALRYE